MKESTKMIRRRVRAFSSGQMVDATEVIGRMANSTEMEPM
jgi:hypothetical protein